MRFLAFDTSVPPPQIPGSASALWLVVSSSSLPSLPRSFLFWVIFCHSSHICSFSGFLFCFFLFCSLLFCSVILSSLFVKQVLFFSFFFWFQSFFFLHSRGGKFWGNVNGKFKSTFDFICCSRQNSTSVKLVSGRNRREKNPGSTPPEKRGCANITWKQQEEHTTFRHSLHGNCFLVPSDRNHRKFFPEFPA